MKKPWSGRFRQKTAKVVERFTESVSFDHRLWRQDIKGSIAHARMLAKQGIISKSDEKKIIKGLKEIAQEIEEGRFQWREELEDVHMNIESALIEKIGPIGGKLHTARSRNDQIVLDLRLYLREETRNIINLIKRLQRRLLSISEKHVETIMPGYTHLQRAQPVTLGHHMLAYVEMFQRDRERLYDSIKRLNTLPLGACAIAGTTLPIDRSYLAKLLGFDSISENSMDAVSDRDFILEFLAASSIIMMHLSRLAEELILWSTVEFSFVELPDAFTTGSSIMPQKKNPDVLELIRGKTGRVYGALVSLLTTMKALPLTYNRDMQEDKEPLFNAVDTLKECLEVLIQMLPKVKFNTQRMEETAPEGFSLATDLAEYLVRKGVPFRESHETVGRIVRYAMDKGVELERLSLDELQRFSSKIEDDVYGYIELRKAVNARISRGATSPAEVKKQIKRWRKIL
jgi:argininosuccinate lyase